MKKRFLAILLVVTVLLMGSNVYAAESEYEIMPCYNVVSAVNSSIASADDGVMMKIWVFTPDSSSLDRVTAEVKLKRASGAVAATYNTTLTKQNNVFIFDEVEDVTISSAYYFEFTAKCYKNGVLVDTLTGTSATKQHNV